MENMGMDFEVVSYRLGFAVVLGQEERSLFEVSVKIRVGELEAKEVAEGHTIFSAFKGAFKKCFCRLFPDFNFDNIDFENDDNLSDLPDLDIDDLLEITNFLRKIVIQEFVSVNSDPVVHNVN
ncbi:MAG: hypothetical protein ABH956_03340 [Candidatus Nealsonbacteria bacterium]